MNSALQAAADAIRSGGVVAYPTEAVYGLGCDPNNRAAVERILALKDRPSDKGLILIAADFDQLVPFVQPIGPTIRARVEPTWPGPNTWLLPTAADTPHWIRGDHDCVAVRVTAHPLAAALCRAAGTALVSTSANRSGDEPARDAETVRSMFGDTLDFVLEGPLGGEKRPTSIRDARTGAVIRPS